MADDAAAAAPAEQLATTVVASAVPAGMLTPSGVSTPGGPATGTITPAMSELPPDQVAYSLKVSLADLCAKAAVLYAQQKNYEEAAEVYARAAEMQAEINGETNPDNAEILFLYGRALFKVGQSKSDVLGGKAPEGGGQEASAAAVTTKPKKASGAPAAAATDEGIIAKAISAGEAGAAAAGSSSSTAAGTAAKDEAAVPEAKKPLFQFAGDEEWDESDNEEAEAGDEDNNEEEEDEDDLAVAFEVLDLSRVLFEKQLEEKKANDTAAAAAADDVAADVEAKGKEAETRDNVAEAGEGEKADGSSRVSGELRHILERLADTHDLLAEISLENERYPNAIVDSRASLAYKKQFLPEESEIIAEAHFKLSLALEFASVTTSSEGQEEGGGEQKEQQVDQELRDEAARELEAAIASTKLKLQNKEVELATLHSPEDNDSTRRQIAEVKDIIADMEQRLVDLRKPPIDLNAAVNGPAGAGLGGLLGALSGAGSAGRVEEAKKGATDLTGLVRKKAKDTAPAAPAASAAAAPAVEAEPATANGNGTKRKAEEPAAGEEDEAKKARTVEAA